MFKPKAPQLTPYPKNGSWLKRTAWTTIGTLKWIAFVRMNSYVKMQPNLTPAHVALVNVMLVCIGLVILQTGWMPLSLLGLFPLLLGLLWLLLVQPFIQGEEQ
jgi:hypothetical protein